MEIMSEPVIGISEPEVVEGKLMLPQETKEQLKAQAEAFLRFIEK